MAERTDWWQPVPLGRTELSVRRLGVASSYGLSARGVEQAFDRGIDLLFWGAIRKADFGRGIRACCARERDRAVVAIQSYARRPGDVPGGVHKALRQLHIDHVDLLVLAWWNEDLPPSILGAARELVEAGKVRSVGISGHNRELFEQFARQEGLDLLMLRYNAAHTGAEREIFPALDAQPGQGPGVLGFTATRWGHLLDPKLVPAGQRTPDAADCYRFVLSDPHVHACLIGPADEAQLDGALEALDRGPLDADEQAWMRAVGEAVRATGRRSVLDRVFAGIDRLRGRRYAQL